MRVINLFGGPGTGKSTVGAELFSLMKWNNYNVELVNEYAKELTWEHRHDILEDQLYVVAKQNRKLARLRGQVDWVITDSPLFLALAYTKPDYISPAFKTMLADLYDSYDNLNILLQREKPYHAVGRSQTESEAREVDIVIKSLLDRSKHQYVTIPADRDAATYILDLISENNGEYWTR